MKWSFIAVISCAILLVWTPNIRAQEPTDLSAMNDQVLQLYYQGKYSEALALATKALKISEDTFGEETAQTAECLNNLGGMYESLGNYTNAVALFTRGLA